MMHLITSIAIASFLFGGTPVAPVAVDNLKSAEEGYFLAAHIPKTYTVKLTGYNALEAQTDEDPFTTASGLYSNPEIIVAKSRDIDLPFGTVVKIDSSNRELTGSCGVEVVSEQIGYRVIGDVTHARKSMQIDVLLDHTKPVDLNGKLLNPSIILGICEGVQIEVVGKIDLDKVPSTQKELAKLIEG
tara:strand:- start:11428 stop:11988 length:561 start_codon:yes stop_codon:yes gene_type:complete